MKINFNGQGMTINFDKVPRLLYFNEQGHGNGQVFLDGVSKKGLHSVYIKAHTDEALPRPIEYKIKFIEKGCHGFKYLAANLKNNLEIGFKILDSKEFELVIRTIKQIIDDERIPEEVRQEYAERFVAAIKPDYVIKDGYGRTIDFGKNE